MNRRRLAFIVLGFVLLGSLGAIVAPSLSVRSVTKSVAHVSAATAPVTGLEEIVLHQAAQALGCSSLVTVSARYQISCEVFPGHANDARIERYADETAAHAAFEQASGSGTLTQFHGYVVYTYQYAQYPGTGLPMNHRYHGWQAGRWLITLADR